MQLELSDAYQSRQREQLSHFLRLQQSEAYFESPTFYFALPPLNLNQFLINFKNRSMDKISKYIKILTLNND